MFEDRIKDLLEMIDFDLCDVYMNRYAIKDRKSPNSYIDFVYIPGEYITEDQTRKFDYKWNRSERLFQVSYSRMDPDEINYFRASSKKDALGNDYCSFELEENGSLYDIFVGKRENQEECHYRKLDVKNDKPLITDVLWKEGNFTVSKKYDGSSIKIELHPLSDYHGVISFYKDDELLETEEVLGDLSLYYSSILSTASDVVLEANQALKTIHPSVLQHMKDEFDGFRTVLFYLEGCYDADGLDDCLKKHGIFTEPDVMQKRR